MIRSLPCALLLACAGPPRPAPLEPSPNDRVYTGLCDASGAVASDDRLVVANDEDNHLVTFSIDGGPPLEYHDVGGPLGVERELDLEGAAQVGDTVWWIGSHGRNSVGKLRPERSVLLPTDRAGRLTGGAIGDLLGPLLASSPQIAEREPLGPKAGGINVEGLAARDGLLWVGLRSPVVDGMAQIVRVDVTGGSARVLDVVGIDLGGRGIRSIEWSPSHEAFWVVAGPSGPDGDFALYRWPGPGQAPAPVEADLGALPVEALVVLPGALLVLADDGGVDRESRPCKERWKDDPADPLVYFRGRILPN